MKALEKARSEWLSPRRRGAPPGRLACVVVACLLAAAEFAAQSPPRIELVVPEGFRSIGGAQQRVLVRRLPEGRSRIRIEIALLRANPKSLDEAIAGERREDETDQPGVPAIATLAGIEAKGLAVVGPWGLAGATERARRRVVLATPQPGYLLRAECAAIREGGEEPDAELIAASDQAFAAVLAGLTLAKGAPARDPKAAPAIDESGRRDYAADAVLPFRLSCPSGWYLAQDLTAAPGRMWLLATPFESEALTAGFPRLPGAIRVTVVGRSAETMLADDPLARAVRILRDSLLAQGPATISESTPRDFGGHPGVLLDIRPEAGSDRHEGRILVIAVGCSLLIAEAHWDRDLAESFSADAEAALDSIRIEATAESATSGGVDGGPFFDIPVDWEAERLASDDASVAWSLRAPDGLELVLRSALLPAASKIGEDAALLREAAARYLRDEATLLDAEGLARRGVLVIPPDRPAEHFALLERDRFSDVFVFVKAGWLHVGIVLGTRGGILGRSFGQAIETLASLRKESEAPATSVIGFSPARPPLETYDLVQARFFPFDADGVIRPELEARITRDEGGRFRLQGGESAESLPRRVQVRATARGLEVEGAEPKLQLALDWEPAKHFFVVPGQALAFWPLPRLP